jgi:hypothetical protein
MKQYLEILTSLMPEDAEIENVLCSSGVRYRISWPLEDEIRENKRSKIIELTFSRELTDDLVNLSEKEKVSAFGRIANALSNKLSYFDPNHDQPNGPPKENWEIGNQFLIES